jgi:hypothetical protein
MSFEMGSTNMETMQQDRTMKQTPPTLRTNFRIPIQQMNSFGR